MGAVFAIDEAIDCGHGPSSVKKAIVKLHLSASHPVGAGTIAANGEALGTALAATSLGCEYVYGIKLISTGAIDALGYIPYGTSGGGTWVAGRGYPVATYKLAMAWGNYDSANDAEHVTVPDTTDLTTPGSALVFEVLYS
jgi:hypothetical protein